jgi:hypothetical protein
VKDLVTGSIRYVGSRYLPELFALLFGSREFVTEKMAAEADAFEGPLYFLSCSIAILVAVLTLAFGLGASASGEVALLITVPILVFVFLITGSIQTIWGALGGRVCARTTFCLLAYVSGTSALVMLVCAFLTRGVYRVVTLVEPDLYLDVSRAYSAGRTIPVNDWALAVAPMVPFLATVIWMGVWLAPVREAFRQRHGLTRGRSFIAQAAYSVAWLIATAAVFLVYGELVHIVLAN